MKKSYHLGCKRISVRSNVLMRFLPSDGVAAIPRFDRRWAGRVIQIDF
jgi:hypothetical protein